MKSALRKALPLLLCLILCICLAPVAWASSFVVTDVTAGSDYIISFDPNGGYGTMEKMIVYSGSDVILPSNCFIREPYIFLGWNTKSDGSGMMYGDEEWIPAGDITYDLTLYAQWDTAILFDPNGGYGSMDPQYITIGEETILQTCKFYRNNYVFSHWNTQPDGSGDSYANEGTIFPATSMTLYAQWVKNYYSVSYNSNGGGGIIGLNTVSKGQSTTVWENAFNAPSFDKIFAEWNTRPDGTGISYHPGDPIRSDDISSDITLYAIWRDKLTISFYPGDDSGDFQIQEVPRETPVKLSAFKSFGFAPPEGQTFAYWKDDFGNRYFNGQEVYLTSDLRLTAVYGETIQITYNANGGTLSSGTQTGNSLRAKAAKDTDYQIYSQEYLRLNRSGYEFLGWALGAGASYPMYMDGEIIPQGFSQDTTLYAVWNQLDFVGIVSITGSMTDMAEQGLVGETLFIDISDETVYFDYSYQWLRDGITVPGAFMQSYMPTAEDYGHRITCRVTANDAMGRSTNVSVNYKDIGVEASYKEIDIVDNSPDENDCLLGLTEGMTYSFNSVDPTDRQPVDSRLVTRGGIKAFPFTKSGTYRFFDTRGRLAATAVASNWFTLNYEITSVSDHGSIGSGTVQMKNGSTVLSAISNFKDKSGNTIIRGNGTNTWLVREGAETDLRLTVRPAGQSCGIVYLNGAELFNAKTEQTFSLGALSGPEFFDIIFLQMNNTPKYDFALTLPASLSEIEDETFAGGGFSYVVVPAQVAKIGSRAFADCQNLRFIEIMGMNVEIAPDAFKNVSELTIFYPYGSNVSDYRPQPGTSITFTPIYR